MKPEQRRRVFQKIKSMSCEQYWQYQNKIHSRAYFLGQKHVREAMECMPGISQKRVEAVIAKAEQIREEWDGLQTIEVEEG